MDEEQDTLRVELCYERRRAFRKVIVRSQESGAVLWTSVVRDGPAALQSAARALAACEARGWTMAKIEAFPWADELGSASANDGARGVRKGARRA